jgi:alpha-galactosidase
LDKWSKEAFGKMTAGKTTDQSNGLANDNTTPRGAFLSAAHPPFSFRYGGKSSATLLSAWHQTEAETKGNGQTVRIVKWTDPKTGLEVKATITSYHDFPAVEWVLHFTNTGSSDTPILEDVQALDETLETLPPAQPVRLRQIAGSEATIHDFVPTERPIEPGQQIVLAPKGGRSSNGVFPFFNLQFGDGGIIAAVGWSGQWKAQIQRSQQGETQIQAGMELTHLLLHPGEAIRTPSILLLRWSGGDWIDAQNQFRRLLLAHYVPRSDGKPAMCCISAQSFNHYFKGARPEWGHEKGQLASAKINKEIGCDTLWMDAAWFVGNFPKGAGNWEVKPAEFPNGLKPISDACHALGLKWLIWWEPERVAPGTRILREHPEFVLKAKGLGLFNLADPEACDWMTRLLNKQISDFGADCYRNDFNMDPLPFWRANDAPDRQGITEIRYIEGLYTMWDAIRQQHPGIWLDNCASGGRRIDIELLRRALVQTRSDSACKPGRTDWEQSQTYGLSLYVPGHATIGWELDTYSMRSTATSGYCGDWDILDPKFPKDQARAAITEIKENQHYWYGDYYPLTPWSLSPDQWIVYQFNCPEKRDGMVLAFRRKESTADKFSVTLRGIREDQNYQVTFIDEDRKESSRNMKGKELTHLELTIGQPRSSLLIRYQAAYDR